jgi:hypothetical protein
MHADVGLPMLTYVGFPMHADVGLPMHTDVGLPMHADVGFPLIADIGLPMHADVGLPMITDVGFPIHADVGLPMHVDWARGLCDDDACGIRRVWAGGFGLRMIERRVVFKAVVVAIMLRTVAVCGCSSPFWIRTSPVRDRHARSRVG